MTVLIHGPATAKMARIRQCYEDADLAVRLREQSRQHESWLAVHVVGKIEPIGWVGRYSGEWLPNPEANGTLPVNPHEVPKLELNHLNARAIGTPDQRNQQGGRR